ncbi:MULTISPECIES: allantoinase AllB [unclassified Cryobacterium]|uniref:allantoinase AllB n=1 Tax=unclassified Cryobacterium TaxID=2649013 RepID=UPI00106ACE60|nr:MULTISPECIES: allantoinase AllB [unclassified Cryobacterium]TFC53533.1 allantoinase AllB [Cryobacterium sp. TMB3-1-2]TFC69199.1 allantoinase AllB [Cryobacterium sp. TMB3-15]TFC76003.1 allantoinase AllB [Cryobacterium sp. TMB3-10]TFD38157.1 allantoinase AllB [Cryobacterium sp. TMB3-12]
MYDLVIRSARVLTEQGFIPAAVAIAGGVIRAIAPVDAPLAARQDVTLPVGQVLQPGIVDTHVHVNEPGRTDWEGFASATRAAAAGGVTTIIDMPLNSIPPTTTVPALELKRAAAAPQATVDVGFWGGAIPGTLGSLRPLHDAGVFGFKAFLSPSGVDEFPHLSSEQLEAAATEIAGFGGLLVVHAEDPSVLESAENAGGTGYRDFVASRPDAAEDAAIARVIAVVRRTGVRAHILHLSSALVLPRLAAARAEGLPITVETCPHYLSFAAESIADGATAFKCCPPIRGEDNRDLLWQGLADGVIDLIASDHSPATRELKLGHGGDFGLAWGGISGLQLSLPAVWTAARARGLTLEQVLHWMSRATADFVGLPSGRIRVGAAADLVAFAPEEVFTVDVDTLRHKNRVSAFDGATLIGRVHTTWLAGNVIYAVDDTAFDGSDASARPPAGRMLTAR